MKYTQAKQSRGWLKVEATNEREEGRGVEWKRNTYIVVKKLNEGKVRQFY